MAGAAKCDISVEIGNRIGRLRTQRGLSQEKLGQITGIKAAQISRIELGDALPKITTIMAICDALHCHYDEILPVSPGMETSINPKLIDLIQALEGLPQELQDQVIDTVLVAAKHYKRA